MSNDDPVMMPEEEYWWFSRDDDDGDDRNAYLTDLITNGLLEGAALGITKRVIHEGLEDLSPKQAAVFHRHVIRPYFSPSCPRCGRDLTWSNLWRHEGWCGDCHHLLYNND